jgi:hypothetical protein
VRGLILVLSLFLAPLTLTAQPARAVGGIVVDTAGEPVGYSNVILNGRTRIVADDMGRFLLMLAPTGRVRLLVRRIGYEDQEVTLAGIPDTALRLVLVPEAGTGPAQLDVGQLRAGALEVNGFYTRLAQRDSGNGSGHFITPGDIAERRPVMPSEMFEGIAGLRLVRATPNDNRRGALGPGRCAMTVYLDRGRLNSLAERSAMILIDDVVSATALAGAEVYLPGDRMPPEYQPMNGTCGVLLLWTR